MAMEIVELVGAILNHVSPAEERVFLRVWLRTYAVGQASCRATFAELAREAALSWTTTKTALLKLEGRGLLSIERHHKAPCTLTPQFIAIGASERASISVGHVAETNIYRLVRWRNVSKIHSTANPRTMNAPHFLMLSKPTDVISIHLFSRL